MPSYGWRTLLNIPKSESHHRTAGNVRAPSNYRLDEVKGKLRIRISPLQGVPSSQSVVTEEYMAPQTRTKISRRNATDNDGVQTPYGDLVTHIK